MNTSSRGLLPLPQMLVALMQQRVYMSFLFIFATILYCAITNFHPEQLSMRLRFLAASDPKMKNRDEVIKTKRGINLFHPFVYEDFDCS